MFLKRQNELIICKLMVSVALCIAYHNMILDLALTISHRHIINHDRNFYNIF